MDSTKKKYFLFLFSICFLLTACDKGYRLRVSNYYLEPLDSVTIGNNLLVFTNVAVKQTTDFKKIPKGNHAFTITTRTKKKFSSSIFISGKGSGNRTIQIDAIKQIFVLEE